MAAREELVQMAMTLAREDRVYIADALELSLSSGGFATSEIAAAWETEIERRIAAYDHVGLPAAEMNAALDRIRRRTADERITRPPSP